MNKNTVTNVEVFFGDWITDPHEEQFLNKLVRDLSQRGIETSIFANLQARGRSGQRQIDFFVLTQHRLAHVELKSLSQTAPLRGSANGNWAQDLGGGRSRSLEGNPYRQAHDGTYALSDVVARIASRLGLSVASHFYRDIDTVVCIDPDIPPDSVLEPYGHVKAVGYAELLDRLGTDGPRPANWTFDQWHAIQRELRLLPMDENTPSERLRREAEAALDDYRQRFIERTSSGLPALVELKMRIGELPVSYGELLGRIKSGEGVALSAPSGFGKSHIAQHVAIALTEAGRVVMAVRCGEYGSSGKKLSALMARSAAAFTGAAATEILRSAKAVGSQVVLILDGFNECPPTQRSDLLGDVAALALRYPSVVLASTTVPIEDVSVTTTIEVVAPDAAERDRIYRANGGRRSASDTMFLTPFDLALAAECEVDLDSGSSLADLYSVYVHRLAPTEAVRRGLRVLALTMVDEFRSAIPIGRATSVLSSAAGLGLGPADVDLTLGCSVLVDDQSHVFFRHELLGRFLASEALALASATLETLVDALEQPGRQELNRFSLSIERDAERRSALFASFHDRNLYTAAVRGELGVEAADHAKSAIAGALAEAAFAMSDESTRIVHTSDEVMFDADWESGVTLSSNQIALVAAAGELLAEGFFIEDSIALLDETDARAYDEAVRMREAGVKGWISGAVAACVHPWSTPGVAAMAATPVLLQTCEMEISHRHSRNGSHVDAVRRLLDGASSTSWTRLYLACILLRFHPGDGALVPVVLRKAWNANGYHLRLMTLMMIHFAGRELNEDLRDEVAEFLESLESSNIWLQSAIVEALAVCGRLQVVLPSVEELANRIREDVLAVEDGPEAWRFAAGAVSSQFEPDEIVGPYYEAVQSLSEVEQLELLVRAARETELRVHWGWVFERLCYSVPTGHEEYDRRIADVFRTEAVGAPRWGVMPDEDIAAHLWSIRGLSRMDLDLPGIDNSTDAEGVGWHLFDQIVATLDRVEPGDLGFVWEQIWSEAPISVIRALFRARWFGRMASVDHQGEALVVDRVIRRYPTEFRRLLEWALGRREELEPEREWDVDYPYNFVVRTLGHVGGPETVGMLRPLLVDRSLERDVATALRELQSRHSGLQGPDVRSTAE